MKQFDIYKDFNFPTEDDWKAAANKLLKGKPFEPTLFSDTEEGLKIEPIYSSENKPDLGLIFKNNKRKWNVAQTLFAANDTFNEVAKDALSKGQTALNIDLDLVSQFGNSAAHIPMFLGNIHITEYEAFDHLFNKIDLTKTPVYFDALCTAGRIFNWLNAYIKANNFANAKVRGGLGFDPISAALKYGGFTDSFDELLKNFAGIAKQRNELPNLDILTIQANLVHNSGGHKVHQLSYALATSVAYINHFQNHGISPKQIMPAIRIKMAIGNEQFLEIAKLRALRLLWANLCDAYNVDPEENIIKIDVETSWRFLSKLDPWTNMLRATSSAFSAIIGGCDSLDVFPFDLALGQPDEFSMRQARNIQFVLAEESNLNKAVDPASGSGYLDRITTEIAERSWQSFQDIEAEGGILKLIRNGKFQEDIEKNAEKQVSEFDSGQRKAIGSNIYQIPDEKRLEEKPEKIQVNILSGKVVEKIRPLVQSRVLENVEKA